MSLAKLVTYTFSCVTWNGRTFDSEFWDHANSSKDMFLVHTQKSYREGTAFGTKYSRMDQV